MTTPLLRVGPNLNFSVSDDNMPEDSDALFEDRRRYRERCLKQRNFGTILSQMTTEFLCVR